VFEKNVGRVTQVGKDRSLVTDKANALAADQVKLIVKQNFDAWTHVI
jgi:hypothetical protein